jgi:hypothetical protein
MPVHRIAEFDIWLEGFDGKNVDIFIAGTTSLANVYSDEALTVVEDNPQLLSSIEINDRQFGKFARPLYTSQPYYLNVGSINQTGVQRPPITSLVAQDASLATVIAAGGSEARTLAEHLAQFVHAKNFGEIGAVAATNNTTITNAIGAVSARGGGNVILPSGSVPFTILNSPANVLLVGAGRGVTILESQEAGVVLTLGGDKAGLAHLTLDGVSVQAGSIGVVGIGKTQLIMDDVEIKRFETGMRFKGLQQAQFYDLYVTVCGTNVKMLGDLDAGDTGLGSIVSNNRWLGGAISFATSLGLDLSYEDAEVLNNFFVDVVMTDNASAIRINGARFSEFENGHWSNNTKNFDVLDDDALDVKNKVQGLRISGHIDGGACDFQDTCLDVVFERCEIEGVAFNLTLPDNPIILRDSLEDAAVTVTGDTTKLLRWATNSRGTVTGLTTGSVATKAWGMELEPGEMVSLRAMVTANQRDGEGRGGFVVEAVAHREGSELDYVSQTSNFTLGEIVTGGTSGATGLIVADADSGTTGTLTLRSIVGDFENGEALTDPLGGDGTTSGTLTAQDVIVGSQTKDIDYDPDTTTLDAVFAANGINLELQVIGVSAEIFNWNCYVQVVRNG